MTPSADLIIPRSHADPIRVPLSTGDILFVMGRNGTGKSSLLHKLNRDHPSDTLRISAHRQTWLSSGSANVTPQQKKQQDANIQNYDLSPDSRWSDQYTTQRTARVLFNLVGAEHARNREITEAAEAEQLDRARELARKQGVLAQLNNLLSLSNLRITISIAADEEIRATRPGGQSYSVAEMSDGERNVVLLAVDILTAKPGTLCLIDEPERHVHRSIITPLLASVFSTRDDCSFVISTHDVMLPGDFPNSSALLLSNCEFEAGQAARWDAELLSSDQPLNEQLMIDILGARRKMIFVEGKANSRSLDQRLYSLLFPGVAVVPKGGHVEVERAVRDVRDIEDSHRIAAFGIIDRDTHTPERVEGLQKDHIYALPCYSVESIYYHPELQRRTATCHAESIGGDVDDRLNAARDAALTQVRRNQEHLVGRLIEEDVRRSVLARIPNRRQIRVGVPLAIEVDVPGLYKEHHDSLSGFIKNNDLDSIIKRYPFRETGGLKAIATSLGFQSQRQYEDAVLQLLQRNGEALRFVRSLFGALVSDIEAEDDSNLPAGRADGVGAQAGE